MSAGVIVTEKSQGIKSAPVVWGLIFGGTFVVGGLVALMIKYGDPQGIPDHDQTPTADLPGPLERPGEDYIASSACRECHQNEHASWHRSYHRQMTQRASPDSVKAPFDGEVVTSGNRSYRMFREGERFFVEGVDVDWEFSNYEYVPDINAVVDPPIAKQEIVMTTGSHHMQQYWIESSKGRELNNLPVVYHIAEDKWMPRESSFMEPPEGARHFKVWNVHCIACHSVGGRPKHNNLNQSLYSEVVEFGIACEACHGPGRAHVEMHRLAKSSGKPVSNDPIVNPESLPKEQSAQVCGQCHSVFDEYDRFAFMDRGFSFRPGKGKLEDERHVLSWDHPHFREDTMARNYFWNDGTVRVGGREYCGLTASPCFHSGEMTCLSCHSLHNSDPNDQLAPRMDGNEACLQCHEDLRSRISEHTHHSADSTGSLCYNCHMPHTSYALFKAIRSHRIVSPSVRLGADRPNACNQCHGDRKISWTADYLEKWYGQKPERPDGETDDASVARTVLNLLKGNAAQRAVAAWTVGWRPMRDTSGPAWQAPFLAPLLNDPYPTVRFVASRSLRTLPGFEDFDYDFMGADVHRADAVDRVIETWSGRFRSPQPDMPELLIRDGRLDLARWNAIRSKRDDSPVYLPE